MMKYKKIEVMYAVPMHSNCYSNLASCIPPRFHNVQQHIPSIPSMLKNVFVEVNSNFAGCKIATVYNSTGYYSHIYIR